MNERALFDIEANGLLEECTTVHCIAINVNFGTTKDTCGITKLYTDIPAALAVLDAADTIVGHNCISYDLLVLWKLYKWKPKAKVEDTFVMSCLMHADISCKTGATGMTAHSLSEWGERLGCSKGSFNGPWDCYTEDMGAYCVQDVEVLAALDNKLQEERIGGKWEQALYMEHMFAKDFAVQGWRGIKLDIPLCTKLVEDVTARMDATAQEVEPLLPARPATKAQLDDYTPPKKCFNKDGSIGVLTKAWFDEVVFDQDKWLGFKFDTWHELPTPTDEQGNRLPLLHDAPMKLGNQPEIKAWLMREGWVPTIWSYQKKKDKNGKLRFVRSDDGKLIPTHPKFHEKGVLCSNLEAINTEFPHVRKVVEWIVLRHRRGLLQSLLNAVREDGTVAATGFALGTPTSRVLHNVVANIPKAEEGVLLGRECRSVFIARTGRKLAGVDASGLELRCLAHYVNSPELTDAIINGTKEEGTDIHSMVAKALNVSRDTAKTAVYAYLYGAGDEKLGAVVGYSGKRARAALLRGISGFDKLMDRVEKAAGRGYIKAIDGREIPVRSKHSALNTLLQSCGSIIVKWATCYMNAEIRRRKLDAWQVCHYHDEVLLDCKPEHAAAAGQLFVEGLQWAGKRFKLHCPLDGNVQIGSDWSEVH